jgi:hypothetical protein
MRWFVAAPVLAACNFGGPPAALDDATKPPPDGGPCAGMSIECADPNTLRTCSGKGAAYVDMPCSWGCFTESAAHCGQLTPTAGAVTANDLMSNGLNGVTLTGGPLLLTSNGTLGPFTAQSMFHNNQPGTQNGIDYQQRTGSGTIAVAVFRFKSLTISTELDLGGADAIALVADGEIKIDGLIDARGNCTGTNGGPGGSAGGANNTDGNGAGKGVHGTDDNIGGGGAGYGGVGGKGGDGTQNNLGGAGGIVNGTDEIMMLVGGSGGGGAGNNGGPGGGGGGALQIVSNTRITLTTRGGINAGGCGGHNGMTGTDAGGGGGAGGAILLEAPVIAIAAGGKLAVNGGGGGGGAASNTASAPDGNLDRTPANGGAGGANGGAGAAGATTDGSPGASTGNKGGGGGGAIGRIRFNTRSGTASIDPAAILSPAISDNTRCTQGPASVK